MRLKDKAILVTGSTTGIGEAIARRCVAEGARVMIHGRDRQRAAALASELAPAAAFHCNDLARAESAAELIDATIAALGRLDALVNNAASTERGDIYTTTPELFDRIIAINLRAPLLLIKAALPHLKRSRGCVLNIGSVNAYCGEPNLLPYSISKGGLMTLSRNLADALAREGVRVNHFNVGWVITPNEYRLKVAEGLPPDWDRHPPRSAAPFGRLIYPEEIAAAAVFWLGDESAVISGSVLELHQHPVIGRNPPKEDER